MKTVDGFWQWFRANRSELEATDSEAIAERLGAVVSSVDERVGVEVSDDDDREVIFTAGGDAGVFEVVRGIVSAAPQLPGRSFIALKPPRGFDFSIRTEYGSTSAAVLRFEPLESKDRPSELGILLLFPPELDLNIAAELAPIIVETGVGEEAAAKISHIAVEYASAKYAEALPIADFGEYLGWHFRRTTQ